MLHLTRHVQFLRAVGDAVRTSFWFVPALMGLCGVVLALLSPAIDALARGSRFAYAAERADALVLLGAVLTSMITMTSLVFSITMVVLTLAASQFGPRLIRNFMARWQTQIVLGTFILTIVYCLLLLARIARGQGDATSGPVSIPAAIGLTLVSVMMLILHIHLLSRSMLSETLIGLVGEELDESIAALDPLGSGGGDDHGRPDAVLPEGFDETARFIGLPRHGYVQAIEYDELVEIARRADLCVGFRFRAGDYLIAHGDQIGLYPAERAGGDIARHVGRVFTMGVHRTPVQDPEFSIRHLVEIAVRALSPGVNDPYTAGAVIDRLSSSLAQLMGKRMPQSVFHDADGRVRVVCERPTIASLVGAAFAQIRQNGGDKPIILIHLALAIGRIAAVVRTADQVALLRDQLHLVSETAERRIDDAGDLQTVRGRVESARQVLDRAELRLGRGLAPGPSC